MIFRKTLICFFLVFMSCHSNADMFVGYDSFCGLPVVVGNDPQIATARTDQYGNKFIHIDPGAMNNWTMSRMFTLAHECAHHLIGHTSQIGNLERFSGGTAKQELEADCWAAQKLASIGFNGEINRAILDHAKTGHFSGSGYPSGVQRANNILNCVGGGGQCETVTHQCNHPAHINGDQLQCSHLVPAHPMGDVIPCQHACSSPWGAAPCHPQGDVIPCQHAVQQHQFDLVQCQHAAHPMGHSEQICH